MDDRTWYGDGCLLFTVERTREQRLRTSRPPAAVDPRRALDRDVPTARGDIDRESPPFTFDGRLTMATLADTSHPH